MENEVMLRQHSAGTAMETTLHLWRTAAEAVATDPVARRRQAYQDIIAVVRQQLLATGTLDDIIAVFDRAELHGIAIRESLCRQGAVLNAEVIVAAACWQHLTALLAQ